MPRLPDNMRLDDTMGPEFSVRIMSVMKTQGIETIGQLRKVLPDLHKWRGLGIKSVKEIRDYFRHNDSDESLFETPEYLEYKLEDTLGTVIALLNDVTTYLVRVALKRRVTTETRNHLRLKLLDAADKVMGLPTYTGD